MTPTECVRLVRFVAARCPAMRMQDETPEAWYVDLVGYDLGDALEAARAASLDKTFIGIGDLVRECEAIVRRRVGQQRVAEREAEIAAENGGDSDPTPVTSGGPAVPLALTGPLHERLPEYQAGRQAAHAERLAREVAAAEREAEREARRAKRAEILAELETVREEEKADA